MICNLGDPMSLRHLVLQLCILLHQYPNYALFIHIPDYIHMCTYTYIYSYTYIYIYIYQYIYIQVQNVLRTSSYGVASISRLLKSIGLFCKRALQKRLYFAKETYDFIQSTNRSHPIINTLHINISRIYS